jgi:hypothetical protein
MHLFVAGTLPPGRHEFCRPRQRGVFPAANAIGAFAAIAQHRGAVKAIIHDEDLRVAAFGDKAFFMSRISG